MCILVETAFLWSTLRFLFFPFFSTFYFLSPPRTSLFLQGNQLRGFRGFFSRSAKSSVDTRSTLRKRSISDHFLRRTVSAPAKGRKKTKLALAESLASITDRKNSTGAGGESVGKEGRVERRHPSRAALTHRPMSMPLDRLLQGQLSLCSTDKDQLDMGADTVIGEYSSLVLWKLWYVLQENSVPGEKKIKYKYK